MTEKVKRVERALDRAIRAFLGSTGDWLLGEHMDDEDAKRFLNYLACAAIEAMPEKEE